MQQQRLKQMASSSPSVSSNSSELASKSSASALTSPTRPSDHPAASVSGGLQSSLSDDLFAISTSQPNFGANASSHAAFNSTSTSLEPLFGTSSTAQTTFGSNTAADAAFGSNSFAPSFGANPALFAPASVSNPFVAQPQPVMVMPQAGWPSSTGSQGL